MRLEDSGAVLQAWLSPGLLSESDLAGSRETAVPKRPSFTTLIKLRDGRLDCNTRDLKKGMRSAVKIRSSSSSTTFTSVRIASLIRRATSESFIKSALSSTYLQGLLNGYETDLNTLVIEIVLLACKIVSESLAEGYEIRAGSSPLATLQDIKPFDLATYLLGRAGRCARQILNLPKTVSSRYYFNLCQNQAESPCYRQQGRRRCRCSVDEGQKHMHAPRHTVSGCSCSHLNAPPPESCIATPSSNITLCRFQPEHGGRISLVGQPLDDLGSTSYIAISHVRSSGLGNSSSNSLPSCQVARLQTMVDEVSQSLGMGTDTPFWIDTLCLPITKDRKSVASTPWRHIFSMAKAVLVLDPPLYEHSFVRSQEALTLIRNSSWKKRLWTLEEGSAAQHLFFQFSEQTVTLENLLADVEEHPNKAVVLPKQTCCPANDEPEKKALHRLVEHLADDLQALRGKFRDAPETAGLDKDKLKRILRLGYLANSIFRYFVEEDEYHGILSIRASLVEIYGSPGCEEQRSPGSGHDLTDLLGRLTLVNSIALPG